MRTLKQQQQNVKLAVVGGGNLKGKTYCGIPLGRPYKRYPKLAKKWGIDDMVIFAGRQNDPVPWYHAADAYVQPSIFDACSLVVLEAMACGLPSITSSTNGVSGIIDQGTHGLVIEDAQSDSQLTDAMQQLVDSNVRTSMGKAARLLLEDYSEQRNYQGIISVYKEIVDKRMTNAAN